MGVIFRSSNLREAGKEGANVRMRLKDNNYQVVGGKVLTSQGDKREGGRGEMVGVFDEGVEGWTWISLG